MKRIFSDHMITKYSPVNIVKTHKILQSKQHCISYYFLANCALNCCCTRVFVICRTEIHVRLVSHCRPESLSLSLSHSLSVSQMAPLCRQERKREKEREEEMFDFQQCQTGLGTNVEKKELQKLTQLQEMKQMRERRRMREREREREDKMFS